MDVSIFNWNVRGLGCPAKRRVVAKMIADKGYNIVCLQEIKIQQIDRDFVAEAAGQKFCDNFICLPALGSRGGILIACSDDFTITRDPVVHCLHSITGTITDRSNNFSWSITVVYGPQLDAYKITFLQEIRDLKPLVRKEWLLLGDFNLIACTVDKSNNNINLPMLGRFRNWIDSLQLREMPLSGRHFTWSNERERTTLTRIDKLLFTVDWEARFPQYHLAPASTALLDHCPLVMRKMDLTKSKAFGFESFWLNLQGIDEIVSEALTKPLRTTDPIRILHAKLSRTAAGLKKGNKELRKRANLATHVANEVLLQLDLAMEDRELSADEWALRRNLKAKLLGIAAIERIQWKQRSRLTTIRSGDVSTNFFHLRANGRRRKNHIASLFGQNGETNDHNEKAVILLKHFKSILGTATPLTSSLY